MVETQAAWGALSTSTFWQPWLIIATMLCLFTLANLKSVPLGWHVRLISALLRALKSSRKRLEEANGPAALFTPTITHSRNNWMECDYNFHKSNSTYFSDFDVGRLELMVRTLGSGIDEVRRELSQTGLGTVDGVPIPVGTRQSNRKSRGNWLETFLRMVRGRGRGSGGGGKAAGLVPPLGGVMCNFHKEIKPGEKFDIYTRILTWDSKWLFLVGHFVKPGTVSKSASHSTEAYRPWETRCGQSDSNAVKGSIPVIYATALAKYCFKSGRISVPPERVLSASQLLPPRPVQENADEIGRKSSQGENTHTGIRQVNGASGKDKSTSHNEWSWARVEEERQRGMKLAQMFMALDQLKDEMVIEQADELPWFG